MKFFSSKCKAQFVSHPFGWSLVISVAIGVVVMLFESFLNNFDPFAGLFEIFIFPLLVGIFFIYPLVLTLLNLIFLFKLRQHAKVRRAGRIIEYTTVIIGFIFTFMYMGLSGINFSANYYEQLYNSEVHTPIFTDALPTLITVACVAVIGYIVLRILPITKQPPLVTVLSISAMYMGTALCIVFVVQLLGRNASADVFCLLPVNLIIISLKVIKEITLDWKVIHHADDVSQFGRKKWMIPLNKFLCTACGLPVLALVLALPLLGVIIAVLSLFGQAPNAIIQAWTQTADWNLSQQAAPPNLYYDEHYLCTVAAGGHRKIVKPLRNGKRHGHEVIVNRQLCVANAFEQLLEKRTPRFHKFIRGAYDTYGYPIARHIKTKMAADMVYFIMKPLEWGFLAVLYLCYVHPEDRIAVQYPHAPLPDKL